MPATEAPEEYIFASALSVAGLAIGRDVYVQMGRRLYANSLIALIGPAALKKGTPLALIDSEIIRPRIDPNDWNLKVVRGTGSAEGLLERFMEEVEETNDKGKPRKVLQPVPERRVVTIEEELGYYLVKAHSDATANLREITCQLWDGVDVSPPTRNRSLQVVKPFYSMLAMTTKETLEARLEEDDILTGLLPRFIFFKGTPREPIAWPDPPSWTGAIALAQGLEDVRAHARSLRNSGRERLEPSQTTREAWEAVYSDLQKQVIRAPTPAIRCMQTRVVIHIVKAALLYAICAGHSCIEQDDLARALALGDYLWCTATEVAATEMGNEVRRVEHKIVQLLQTNPGTWVKTRDLQQRLSGRIDADRFHRALRALIKLHVLEADPPGEDERPRLLKVKE